MKANKMVVTALVLGSSLLAGCAGQVKPTYDKPAPIVCGEPGMNTGQPVAARFSRDGRQSYQEPLSLLASNS